MFSIHKFCRCFGYGIAGSFLFGVILKGVPGPARDYWTAFAMFFDISVAFATFVFLSSWVSLVYLMYALDNRFDVEFSIPVVLSCSGSFAGMLSYHTGDILAALASLGAFFCVYGLFSYIVRFICNRIHM